SRVGSFAGCVLGFLCSCGGCILGCTCRGSGCSRGRTRCCSRRAAGVFARLIAAAWFRIHAYTAGLQPGIALLGALHLGLVPVVGLQHGAVAAQSYTLTVVRRQNPIAAGLFQASLDGGLVSAGSSGSRVLIAWVTLVCGVGRGLLVA